MAQRAGTANSAWGALRANWIYLKVGARWGLGFRKGLERHYPTCAEPFARGTEALGAEKGERASGRQGCKNRDRRRAAIAKDTPGAIEASNAGAAEGWFARRRRQRTVTNPRIELHLQRARRGISRAPAPIMIQEIGFALDSALEGDGFELAVIMPAVRCGRGCRARFRRLIRSPDPLRLGRTSIAPLADSRNC
jgi:hypothetical protein